MRTLDFGNDLSQSSDGTFVISDRQRLCSRLLAYLAFPECLKRRNQFLAAWGAKALQFEFDRMDRSGTDVAHDDHEINGGGALSSKSGKRSLANKKVELLQDYFRTFGGGFGPLVAAAYSDPLQVTLKSCLDGALLAGDRLMFTAVMAAHHQKDLRGGASLGKAADLVAELNRESEGPKSKNPVMKAWASHCHVAHLAAAAALVARKLRGLNPEDASKVIPMRSILEQTEEFLQLSQDFLDFGLTFAADRSTRPILDRERVWHLPFELTSRPLENILYPLSQRHLAFLKEMRWAPVPID